MVVDDCGQICDYHETMFVLVLFTDNIFFICEPSHVSEVKKKCPAVKFSDGKKYTARVLALHEDRVVLEEIKANLEDELKFVSFKTSPLTERDLLYTDVINRQENDKDAGKLYLDPILLPAQNENSKTCSFTLGGQDETKDFFKIQSCFVGQRILSSNVDESPPVPRNRNAAGNNHAKTLAEKVDNSQNVAPRKCSRTIVTSGNGVHGEETDLKTLIFDNHNTRKFNTGDQSCIKQSSTKCVSPKKNPTNLLTTRQLRSNETIQHPTLIVSEKIANQPKTKHIAAKHMNNEDNMRSVTIFEYQVIDEKTPTEDISKGQSCSARNISDLASKKHLDNNKSPMDNTSMESIVTDKGTTKYNIENGVLDPTGTPKRITDFQKLKEENVTYHALYDCTKKEAHNFEHQHLSEDKTTEQTLNDQKLAETDTTGHTSESENKRFDMERTKEHISKMQSPNKLIKKSHDAKVHTKKEKNTIEYKQNSEAHFFDNENNNQRDSRVQTLDRMEMTEGISESQIVDAEITVTHNCTNQILTNKNMTEVASVELILDPRNTDEPLSQRKFLERIIATPDVAIGIAVDQSGQSIEDFVKNSQISKNSSIDENCNVAPSRCEDFETRKIDINSNPVVDQSKENFEDEIDEECHVHENSDNVENHDVSFDITFDYSCKEKLDGDFKTFLETKVDNEKSFKDSTAEKEGPYAEIDPEAIYTLDLQPLEFPADYASTGIFLDDSVSLNENRAQPRLNHDVMLGGNMTPDRVNRSSSRLRESFSSLHPAGYSTVLESPTHSTYDRNEGDIESRNNSDDDDYYPSAAESSDSNEISTIDEMPEKSIGHKKKQQKNNSSLNITLGTNRPGMSAPDDEELVVLTSKATASYAKKNFCFYCEKFQSKLARHLELAHSKEEDVKKFAALPPKNRERAQIIAAIRKNGNHVYNTDRRFNNGELLVVRRPQAKMKRTAMDYIACGNCKGQYSRAVARHHFRECTNKDSKRERLVMVKGRKIAARIHEKANALVRKHVMPYMREDVVARTIRYDELVILFANKQCEKYGLHQHHYPMIRARMRLLGRFLICIKERDKAIKNFSDVFHPGYYDHTVEAVKIIAGFDDSTRTYAHPAVASNLGTLLKQLGEIRRSECIKAQLATEQKCVEDFLKLQSENFGTSVNRAVLETQQQNNRRKRVVLPNLDDITTLHNFLQSERQTHFNILESEFCNVSWRKLAEVTLISLQLFNRRRAGEIERVYLEDFNSYQGIDKVADKDTFNALSKEGQALAKKYVRFMIRGKLGRGVPVLVPSNLLESLLLIVKYRRQATVPDSNPYLFGIPSTDRDRLKYLRACDLLRQFSQECGAEMPNTLRGTQLRKHVATRCITLNLDENQTTALANFMGHADKIHKEIYRQPVLQNDIVKISQLLEIAQGTKDPTQDNEESTDEDEVSNGSGVGVTDSSDDERQGTSIRSKGCNSSLSISRSRRSISATRPGTTHRRWTDKEHDIVLAAFGSTIRGGKMPSGEEMQKLIDSNECFTGRVVPQMRTWLHNQKKKLKL